MSTVKVTLVKEEGDLDTEVTQEIAAFDEAFCEIQDDKAPLTGYERALLRSYLVWKLKIAA